MNTQTLTQIWSFIVAHKGWFIGAVSAIPTLITALTPYPKLKGVTSVLSTILNIFSIMTHSDSPLSLKLPVVQMSAPPATQAQTIPSGILGSGLGVKAVATVTAFVFALTLGGCTFFKGIEKGSESCGTNAILQVFSNMSTANVVEDIAEGLVCEVQAIEAYEENKIGLAQQAAAADAGTSSTDLVLGAVSPTSGGNSDAKILALAKQYLAKHK